jgi:hypothetical protein
MIVNVIISQSWRWKTRNETTVKNVSSVLSVKYSKYFPLFRGDVVLVVVVRYDSSLFLSNFLVRVLSTSTPVLMYYGLRSTMMLVLQVSALSDEI